MNLFSCLHTLVCWLAQVTPSHSPLFGLYLAVKLLPTHIYHFCLRMWCGWLAQVDSNHRPRAYQARALTTWAMSHYRGRPRSRDSPSFFRSVHLVHETVICIFGSLASACLSGGGDDGIRTHDPLLAGQVLSQLSYTPIFYGTLLFLLERSFKIEQRIDYSDKPVILCRIHLVMYGRFSIERRWSSRTFRYGYLVTT